jgi:hypothetical protein
VEKIRKTGHGPGTRFVFLDHIPSPLFLDIPPKFREPRFDELALEPLPGPMSRDDVASIPLM